MEEKEMTFEKALERLEQIVRQLESGNVALDNLMQLYDEGTALVKFCTEKLSAAEQKVKLVQLQNGTLKEEDFNAQ